MNPPPDPTPAATTLAGCLSGPPQGARATRLTQLFERTQPPNARIIWVVDLLLRELPEVSEGIWLFADWAVGQDDGRPLLADLSKPSASYDAPHCLSITGGQILSAPGVALAFNLVEGRPTENFPADWFETRVFNLRVLYRACEARSREWLKTRTSLPSGPTPTAPPPS